MSKLLNALAQEVGRGALLPLQRPRTVATKQKIDRKKNDLRYLMTLCVLTFCLSKIYRGIQRTKYFVCNKYFVATNILFAGYIYIFFVAGWIPL